MMDPLQKVNYIKTQKSKDSFPKVANDAIENFRRAFSYLKKLDKTLELM